MCLEAPECVRLAGPELDRPGPVAPALGVVEHPHARPIPMPDLGQAGGQGDGVSELGQHVRFPVGVDLVLAWVGRVIRRRVRRADLGQAPLHPSEFPARVAERRAAKPQRVDRMPAAAAVHDRRLVGMLRVAGGRLEDEIAPGANVVLHDFHHAGEILRARLLVKPALAGLAAVDLAGRHDRVVVPHRAVGISDRWHRPGRLVDDRRELIDQPVTLVVVEQ